jgi:hypothetical protein
MTLGDDDGEFNHSDSWVSVNRYDCLRLSKLHIQAVRDIECAELSALSSHQHSRLSDLPL